MPFIFYWIQDERGKMSDCQVVEHPDAAEVLAVFDLLEPYDGPRALCWAETVTMCHGNEPDTLPALVGAYLLETYGGPARQGLFDRLPIGVLRAAVEYQVAFHESIAASALARGKALDTQTQMARTLCDALAARESKS